MLDKTYLSMKVPTTLEEELQAQVLVMARVQTKIIHIINLEKVNSIDLQVLTMKSGRSLEIHKNH